MKYKLINKQTGEEHLCNKIVVDVWDYYVSDKMPNVGSPFYDKELNCVAWRTDNSLVHKNDVEIIAANDPSIDIPKVVDEVETLAESIIPNLLYKKYVKTGFIGGYNNSQKTHPYSDDDMIEFLDFSKSTNQEKSIYEARCLLSGKHIESKELLQLWKEQRTKTLYYE